MTTPPDTANDMVPIRAVHGWPPRSRWDQSLGRRRVAQAMIIIASICGLALATSQLLTQPNPADGTCRIPGSALTSYCSQPSPSPQRAPAPPHIGPP